MTPNALQRTDFSFPTWFDRYEGKVRDVYNVANLALVLVATDRISAFDHVLPRAIPFKGQVLNQIAAYFLAATEDIVPNHVISVPDPNVTIGRKCDAIPIEMVVRGYLAGHAWRVYRDGGRELCGVSLPDGLKENDKLPIPIITPSTKSKIGHDEDISEAEILKSGLVEPQQWEELKHYALALFERGTQMAAEKGLILVDTKYEFGFFEEDLIVLIDEIHTPDSSRYFYLDTYAELQAAGKPQRQLSKEFVREWLMERGFQGREGEAMPEMDDAFVNQITQRYIELYEKVTGQAFQHAPTDAMEARIYANITQSLKGMGLEF